MPDGSGTTPYHSLPFGRSGRGAIFSLEVTERRGGAALAMAVEHRDARDPVWSSAGSVSVSAPGVSMLRVSGLKEELRLRFTFEGCGAVEFAHVHVPPPKWLPD